MFMTYEDIKLTILNGKDSSYWKEQINHIGKSITHVIVWLWVSLLFYILHISFK